MSELESNWFNDLVPEKIYVTEDEFNKLLSLIDKSSEPSPGLKRLFEQHPPERFRDISNGE